MEEVGDGAKLCCSFDVDNATGKMEAVLTGMPMTVFLDCTTSPSAGLDMVAVVATEKRKRRVE